MGKGSDLGMTIFCVAPFSIAMAISSCFRPGAVTKKRCRPGSIGCVTVQAARGIEVPFRAMVSPSTSAPAASSNEMRGSSGSSACRWFCLI